MDEVKKITPTGEDEKPIELIYMDESTKRLPKILVVEDEIINRNLVIRHLKRFGIQKIDEAGDGIEALKLIRQNEYDLILSDLEMPNMGGLELLKEVKIDFKLNAIPVIIISGVDQVKMIAHCIELGAEDHLTKPFDPILMRARVLVSLEKKRLRDREKEYLQAIRDEKKNTSELLNVILPKKVALELRKFGYVQPRRHHEVAILFCDIVSFTDYCNHHTPEVVISNLQLVFELFEEIVIKYEMEKIKTIGDAFMAVAGLTTIEDNPFLTALNVGFDMIEAVKNSGTGWQVRIGIHQGTVVAGVVGSIKYQYDVWGDSVNIASRMTGQASPNSVAFAHRFWPEIQHLFEAKSLGKRNIKGIGETEVVECYGRMVGKNPKVDSAS